MARRTMNDRQSLRGVQPGAATAPPEFAPPNAGRAAATPEERPHPAERNTASPAHLPGAESAGRGTSLPITVGRGVTLEGSGVAGDAERSALSGLQSVLGLLDW